MEGYTWVVLPLIAAALLVVTHSYLGLHILRRKVIFVDLALAQIAALGTTYAFLIGIPPSSGVSYLFSLVFTILGAIVFSITRMRGEKVPQEAIIGIAYVVAGAAAIVLIDSAQDPHGAEHIKKLLSGNIVWVTGGEVAKTALLYAGVAALHGALFKKFLLISNDADGAADQGMNIRLWDFLFYLSFGLIITASVQIAGVLLVFSYLVVPAVFAFLFADGFWRQLALACGFAMLVSLIGILLSYDRPMGPTIVSVFGVGLIVAALGRFLWKHPSRAAKVRVLGSVAAIGLVIAGLAVFGLSQRGHGHDHEHAHADEHEAPVTVEPHDDPPPAAPPQDDPDLDALIGDAEEEAGK